MKADRRSDEKEGPISTSGWRSQGATGVVEVTERVDAKGYSEGCVVEV